MEDTLRVKIIHDSRFGVEVLILVLMEDTLRGAPVERPVLPDMS